MLTRITRLTSHAAHARWLASVEDTPFVVPRQPDLRTPYTYSPEWLVYVYGGAFVTVQETAHRQYDVFLVPVEMLESNPDLEEEDGCE